LPALNRFKFSGLQDQKPTAGAFGVALRPCNFFSGLAFCLDLPPDRIRLLRIEALSNVLLFLCGISPIRIGSSMYISYRLSFTKIFGACAPSRKAAAKCSFECNKHLITPPALHGDCRTGYNYVLSVHARCPRTTAHLHLLLRACEPPLEMEAYSEEQ
jgi:hypothetical protein